MILDLIMVKASYLWLGTCGAFKRLSWRHLDRQAWCRRQRGKCPLNIPQHWRAGGGPAESRGLGRGRCKDKEGGAEKCSVSSGVNRCTSQNENSKHTRLSCLVHQAFQESKTVFTCSLGGSGLQDIPRIGGSPVSAPVSPACVSGS